jgi:hypothetical protein
MTVLEDTAVSALGEPGPDEDRVVIAEIKLAPGQKVREIKREKWP